MRKSRIKIGDVFGNLVVKSDVITHVTKNGTKYSGRICLCKLCGEEKSYCLSSIKKNGIKSCKKCTSKAQVKLLSKEVAQQIHIRYQNSNISVAKLAKSIGVGPDEVRDILHQRGKYRHYGLTRHRGNILGLNWPKSTNVLT